MHPRPAHVYTRVLKAALPPRVHEPATSRLFWLPVHGLVVALGMFVLTLEGMPLLLAPLVSLVVGSSFAGLTFLAHETLHGSVVHGRSKQRLIGSLCFLPFAISPRLWVSWHNRVHHGNAQRADVDPDAYPTLERYRGSRLTRLMIDTLGAHRGAVAGALALFLGFSIHSLHMLLAARDLRLLETREQRLACVESLFGFAFWIFIGAWLGLVPFVFGFVGSLLVANVIVMAHILTNHSLSPLTKVNDPLLNSLSVTVPKWVSFLTLGFGFHVEHHLYPWMSPRHARVVRRLLRSHWPERYQSLPLWKALFRVYTTPRIYADPTTLVDGRSGHTWPTLIPRAATEPRVEGHHRLDCCQISSPPGS